MSISLGGGGFGVKRHAFQQNAEMNVTPFVDVMLVLLIIFMVAAPLATVNVPLDLPPASTNPNPPPRDPIFISIQRDGSLFVGDDKIDVASLPPTLVTQSQGDR